MMFVRVLLVLLVSACASAGPPVFPSPVPAPEPASESRQPPPPQIPEPANLPLANVRRAAPVPGEPVPRPYGRVIPSNAITSEGLFTTHRVGSKVFFEIPRAELEKDMLLVTQVARSPVGGYGGQPIGNHVLRWERRGNRILLRRVTHEITADSTLPIYRAVEAANYHPIVAVFDVEAFGRDSTAVIDVSRLYTTPNPEFSAAYRIGNLDPSRTFIENVSTFPENIEVEATQTFHVPPPRADAPSGRGQPAPQSASVLMHWSMIRLPDNPMTPRLFDNRVGFYAVVRQDYGSPEHRMVERRYITRWRLECAEGEVIPCEPAKPITFYVDPAAPARWVPWIKRGVEDWQEAFEAAGFRNAIIARDAPTPGEDPDWAPEDARFSVIRWLPSPIENAQGPHVHDPRTGEILEADIKVHHNILNLLRDWYFVQVSPLDPRAQRLPLPDSLMGRLLQHVVAHEVGHTLGFPHNQKASATYAADSIRDPDFVRRMGHTPSIMDYSRFNYVAQPEDSIPTEMLIPDIGPYDRFATMWGYRPIPGIHTPEAERSTLDLWARRQDQLPYLRFTTSGSRGADVGDHTEAVGDADPVQSTRLGIRNLERVVPMLIPGAIQPERDYSDLLELYDRLVAQWATELTHVVTLVGGVESQEKVGGQPGTRFQPVAPERQAEAMSFLAEAAFRTPEFLLDTEILRRIEVEGALDRIGRAQERLLLSLLDPERMKRIVEFEALAKPDEEVYTLGEMLRDLRRGVWSELDQPGVRIDPFRRNLQRAYLDTVEDRIAPPDRSAADPSRSAPPGGAERSLMPSDARALLRGELHELDRAVRRATPRTADRTTRLHLEDIHAQIERILDPGR